MVKHVAKDEAVDVVKRQGQFFKSLDIHVNDLGEMLSGNDSGTLVLLDTQTSQPRSLMRCEPSKPPAHPSSTTRLQLGETARAILRLAALIICSHIAKIF